MLVIYHCTSVYKHAESILKARQVPDLNAVPFSELWNYRNKVAVGGG